MRQAALFVAIAGVAGTATSLGVAGQAAERFTIQARPAILRWSEAATLSGTLAMAKPGETVTIEQQRCGQKAWESAVETRTSDESWSASVAAGITALYRATADGATSAPVRVQQRPAVLLARLRAGTFRISVGARVPFWHRRVTLQRLDRGRGVWRDVRSILLTDSGAAPGSTYVWSSTDVFRPKLPKGTTVRATLPISVGKPCYLGGYSNLITL